MIKKGLFRLGVFFLYLISLLPFWFLYLIANGLFVLLYYVLRYRREVVWQNLRNSFPERTEAELKDIERKYFRYLADLIVEGVKLFTISAKEVENRLVVNNTELMENYFAQGRSVIGAVGHYGNWEMAALRLGLLTDKRRIVVYKPLNNEVFDSAFKRMRERFGATLVDMQHTLRALITFRNEPSITMLVSDQTPVPHEINYFTQFLNQPTAVFLGVEKLAKALDSAVIFVAMKRVKRGYYEADFVSLCEHPKQTAEYEITQMHVRCLEHMICREPQYWLWSHRRWKFTPEWLVANRKFKPEGINT
jgi:KDO2-lipid IV(A) lauroyltransferase